MAMNFEQQFLAARRAATPLVNIRTFDAASTVATITKLIGTPEEPAAIVLWDTMNGYRPVNDAATASLHSVFGTNLEATAVLPEALRRSTEFDDDTTIIISNAHLFLTGTEAPPVIQGIWNLRDTFKKQGNMLVLLSIAGSTLPPELLNDVLVLDEPLPTEKDLEKIVSDVYGYASFGTPDPITMNGAVNALIGLPVFPAEQASVMCLVKESKSLDIDSLWQRKREIINQTPGLTVWSGDNSVERLGGLKSIKHFMHSVMTGKDAPRLIMYTDEIEKAVAGTGTDMSGVKTELTGQVLSWTQDKEIDGVLCIGVPGVGKSELPKALGGTFGVPVIDFDLAGMQAGIVGSSGANLRAAIATINAISAGQILWIASCNSIEALPPELRSRFQLGTFFFDSPDSDERVAIWTIYRKRYTIDAKDALPNDSGWTGREIKECCKKAYRLNLTLKEAAKYVVPVTVSARDAIEALRTSASGKYLSASKGGVYIYAGNAQAQQDAGNASGRKLRE